MTPKKFNIVYESLTPHQLAILGYESCIECDGIEADRIRHIAQKSDALFIHRYRCRLNMLSSVISTWGIEYWQTMAGIIAYEHVISGEPPLLNGYNSIGLHHKINALVVTLKAICTETGLDIDKILEYLSISTESFKAHSDVPSVALDESLNDEYTGRFLELLKT